MSLFNNGMGSVYVWQISCDIQLQIQSVMWYFRKQEMNVNWHLHFLLKCHLNVTWLVVCPISNSDVSIDVWFFSSQVTFQIVCVNWCAFSFLFFLCTCLWVNCQKLARTLSKLHTSYGVYVYVTWWSTSWLKVYIYNIWH